MAGNGHVPARPEPAAPQDQPRPAMFPRHQDQGTFGPPAPELCDLGSELARSRSQPGRTRDAHSTKHPVVLHLGKLSAAHSAVQGDGARAKPLQIPTGLDVGRLWRCPAPLAPRAQQHPGAITPNHSQERKPTPSTTPQAHSRGISHGTRRRSCLFSPTPSQNLPPRASRSLLSLAVRQCRALP